MTPIAALSALAIAEQVRSGAISARAVIDATLSRIAKHDGALNCFTRVLNARAFAQADKIDAMIARGENPGVFAGAPFAVKDLFDVAGLATTAGARMREKAPPAVRDAPAIEQLERAGAILVGTLNMDEFAYGFSTENACYGVTRNPHDPARLAGGSSGGSAAAVAAGLVPLALGSDTNGSIRVPASLCGVFGLRPTHSALSEEGVFPFVARLDTVGPFARDAEDLRVAFGLLSGRARTAHEGPIRAVRLKGWFNDNADEQARASVDAVCKTLSAENEIDFPGAAAARSAAFIITASEGGRRHLEGLRTDAESFDPATRPRFAAGALAPLEMVTTAEKVAARFVSDFEIALRSCDVMIAPATPCAAPRIDDGAITLNGKTLPARANLGLLAQPLSLTGAPVLTVPVVQSGALPLGVQLIAARGKEDVLFAAAARLIDAGVVAYRAPPGGA